MYLPSYPRRVLTVIVLQRSTEIQLLKQTCEPKHVYLSKFQVDFGILLKPGSHMSHLSVIASRFRRTENRLNAKTSSNYKKSSCPWIDFRLEKKIEKIVYSVNTLLNGIIPYSWLTWLSEFGFSIVITCTVMGKFVGSALGGLCVSGDILLNFEG